MSGLAETITVERARESAVGYQSAIALACVLCALLTLASLLVPPTLSHDPAWGMEEWRSYIAGNPMNTVVHPDASDISRDQVNRLTWWSPGQYLVPGVLTRLGIRLGTAVSIVVGASLLACLLGWVQLAKYFALDPRTTAFLVILIGTFRYSTLPFGVYNGGEILLQGLTPWIILAGCSVPSTTVLRAAGLAFAAILVAFFAKLTGMIVAGAALFAGVVEALTRVRRITAGMIGGAVGAVAALAVLDFVWFARGSTPASGTGWSLRTGDVLFAWGAAWGAGVSWIDMFTSVLLNRWHSAVGAAGTENDHLNLILWLLLPPTLFFGGVLAQGWRRFSDDPNLTRLLKITALFYLVCAGAISVIFLRGGDVSVEERHLRAAGMLILVSVIAITSRLPRNSRSRIAIYGLCILMSLFGAFAYARRAHSTRRADIDGYSSVYEPSVNGSAIEFLRSAFLREGTNAVYVLPSPEVACVFPPRARILLNHIEFESEETISARQYHGRVGGGLYVVLPAELAQSTKEMLLLKEFVDYPVDGWKKHNFGTSTVFVQPGLSAQQ